jgi:hypothetical protein
MTNNLDPIDIASQFVGTDNRATFNDWIYMAKGNLAPYCGAFVSYCRAMGGMDLGRVDLLRGFVGVPFAVKFYSDKKQLTDKPVRNDIVFFDWSGIKDITKPQSFIHTGLFKCDNGDGTFTSIEGNTSNQNIHTTGSESNGGWVMEKRRPYTVAIFAHPQNPIA